MSLLTHPFFKEIEANSSINAEFIRSASLGLSKYGIKIKIYDKPTIEESGGYFEAENRILGIAVPDNACPINVVATFAHEYCHFLQWKTSMKVWTDVDFHIDDYLDPKTYKEDHSPELKLIQTLERDCEKMVLSLIKKGKLDLCYDTYLREANYYIAFHDIILITKKWFSRAEIPDEVLKLLPKNKLIKTIDCLKTKKYEFIIKCIKAAY